MQQNEEIRIPVSSEELEQIGARADIAGSTLPDFCRGLLGLEVTTQPVTAVVASDAAEADALVAVLGEDSAQKDAAVARLSEAPHTDAAELDKALAVVREAVAAERAFALEARLAISAMERDED